MILERPNLFEDIVLRLSVLRYVVEYKSKHGLTDLNRHCEDFFCTVLNIIYEYDLVNLNAATRNAAAIDLGDKERSICYQLSATSTSTKIDETIRKFVRHGLYRDYRTLKVLVLTEKTHHSKTFDTEGHFAFDKATDILDIANLLEVIERLPDDRLQRLSEYISANTPQLTQAMMLPYALLPGDDYALIRQLVSTHTEAIVGLANETEHLAVEVDRELYEKYVRLHDSLIDLIHRIFDDEAQSLLRAWYESIDVTLRIISDVFYVESGWRRKFNNGYCPQAVLAQKKLQLLDSLQSMNLAYGKVRAVLCY